MLQDFKGGTIKQQVLKIYIQIHICVYTKLKLRLWRSGEDYHCNWARDSNNQLRKGRLQYR